MATLGWPAFGQEICLDAVAIDGRLVSRSLISTRPSGIVGALAAQPIEQIPRRLLQLFPLCGTAHAIAGMTALEAALGIEVSSAQKAFRNLLLLAEHGAALGWRILMEWPTLLGAPPQLRACADIRRAVASVPGFATLAPWTRVGGIELRLDHDGLHHTVSTLATMLANLFPEASDPELSWRGMESALRDGRSTAARTVNAARDGAMVDYGCHDRPLLSSKGAQWFARRFVSDPDFPDAPTLDGTPAEVGPLAARRHPLTAEATVHWGPTLATRLLAAALDAPVIAGRLMHTRQKLSDDAPVVTAELMRTGHGAGVVETARGPLAYDIEMAAGRVETLRSVAPTEWNFHAEGPFMAALHAAPPVPDPLFAARLLAASFDPCVPFMVDTSSNSRSSSDAERVYHA